jgi:uncharacterized SAM-binding protein YcdF (DUF218 family)
MIPPSPTEGAWQVTTEPVVPARTAWRRIGNPLLIAVVAIELAFAALTARVFVWPDLPSLPPRASAIVELAGPSDGGRDAVALALASAGRAPVLVQSTTVSDSAADMCLPPVRGVTVMCFHPDPGTTRGEAQDIGRMAATDGWSSVILVTTPDQAWRARLRVTRCFPGPVYVDTTPLPVWEWLTQIPYQWAASIKALAFQTAC